MSATPERIAYTVSQAAAAVGLSRYVIYNAITRGELRAYDRVKFVILAEDLKAWIVGQPAQSNMKPRGPAATQNTRAVAAG